MHRMFLLLLAAAFVWPGAMAQPLKAGAGTYFAAPKGNEPRVPQAPMRTEEMLKTAAQTNQWYSTLLFNARPEPIYAHPLTIRPTAAGMEVALPVKEVIPTERRDVEIHYAHKNPILVSPVAFEPGPAKLARASDWAIDISMARGTDDMRVTVAHGSPYTSFQISRGDVRLKLPAAGKRIESGTDARILALQVGTQRFAAFGPTGVVWEPVSDTEWLGRLPAGKGYFAVAAVPDTEPATLQLLARHAYAFIQDTRAEWRFDQAQSKVETVFKVQSRVMEGADNGPLLGLYPHQWHDNPAVAGKLGPAYDSVRGPIRLLAGAEFKIERTYPGFVPQWPGLGESAGAKELSGLLKTDVRQRRELFPYKENLDNWRTSAYWQGKGLTRFTQLAAVAEQQGDLAARDQLLAMVKDRMEFWFSGEGSRNYFHYDKGIGTMVTYPDEFFAVEQMNDHHFHYGYWIRAAAEIALRDPAWAAKDRWGAMVDLLVKDIANSQRGGSDFPFLRNFDVYESHSWASGVGLGAWGNNQESSSEAINAWAGLILWGEVTGDRALRDLGVWLYTSEIQAIEHYWFDLHGLVFAPEYKAKSAEVSMLFGGKYAHNTWWTDEPRQIKGINLLPMTTASTYMGRDKAFIQRSLATLPGEIETYLARGKNYREVPKDIWQDVFAKYMALADPAAGLARWDRWGSVEGGDTRTHTLHWLLSLNEMGPPDLTVTADTALYSVFKRADGKKTYLVYNAGKAPISVRFSDGKVLEVAPGTLGRAQ
jgi:endoglucanase Acf2